ncbi:helix-turn-helix domain-containing protein [Natronoglycomyces albus]|uniref:Helix-turn-helix domain-containing protein n=1 Tax=Natronoglycomyces albus TaxID=2811108 RepID=A0A895XJQ5_9ACTN|nr:helix-turn-helix transcriptional regulator [Natronoglycomyces albus]QSB05991.1 helix-turn-helix domain-containing protein [Natronoglycomyces albus]
MTKQAQPTLARRTLGAKLRKLRMERGDTCTQVASAIGYKYKAVDRIEKGLQGTKFLQLEGLCDYYGVSSSARSHMHTLRVRGAERGWWEDYYDPGTKEATSPDFPLFLEAEQDAIHIRAIEIELIPGLVQTREYLQALQEVQLPVPNEVAESVKNLRERRQELFYNRPDPPKVEHFIGRNAIEFLADTGDDVRQGQLAMLRKVNALENFDIRVIDRIHAATLAGSFWLMKLNDDLPSFVFVDALDGCRYIEQVDIVSRYEEVFNAVRRSTVPLEEYL